jgi:hypothetical protein
MSLVSIDRFIQTDTYNEVRHVHRLKLSDSVYAVDGCKDRSLMGRCRMSLTVPCDSIALFHQQSI